MVDSPHKNIKFLLNEAREVQRSTIVLGEITSIDRSFCRATVSTAEYGTLSNIPIHYHCEGADEPFPDAHSAFNEGDIVLVLSKNAIVEVNPERWIVGFADGRPHPCGANFWIDLQIDGHDLVYGGQAIYIRYTNFSGEEVTVGPKYVPADKDRASEGYSMGIVGNFWLQGIDPEQPVYMGLGRQRAIGEGNCTLLDEDDPSNPFSLLDDRDYDSVCDELVNRWRGITSVVTGYPGGGAGSYRRINHYGGLEFMHCYFCHSSVPGATDAMSTFNIEVDYTDPDEERRVAHLYGFNDQWPSGCQCGEYGSSLPGGVGSCTRNSDVVYGPVPIIWKEITYASLIGSVGFQTIVIPPGHPQEGETRSVAVADFNWNLGLKIKEHLVKGTGSHSVPRETINNDEEQRWYGNAFFPDSVWNAQNEARHYGNNLITDQSWDVTPEGGGPPFDPEYIWSDGAKFWDGEYSASDDWEPPDDGIFYLLVADEESPPSMDDWIRTIIYTSTGGRYDPPPPVDPEGIVYGITSVFDRTNEIKMVDTPIYWF